MSLSKKHWFKATICAAILGSALTSVAASGDSAMLPLASATSLSPGYLECDGSRYMTIPHSSDFDIAAGGSMTVSAKVWLDSYGAHRGIVANRWHAGTSNAATTGFEIYGGNSATQSMSNNVNLNKGSWNNIGHAWCNTLATGTWAVVTWVLDGQAGTSKMYLDGILKNTVNPAIASYPINPQADILVGTRYNISDGVAASVDMNSCWVGRIDDVRIYSRALSANEVVADMTASVGPDTDGLIAAYDFTDLTGTTAPDISGNGHNATLVGFPDYSATGSLLTIVQPADGSGTITVTDGTAALVTGSKVEDGTILTVTATPADDYVLDGIRVNGSAISGNTFTMQGDATVTASFSRDPAAPTKVLVFDMDEDGSRYYRIPALVTAADGSLVAIADKRGDALNDLPNTISVVAKRSTDGGMTWSQAVTIAQGNSATGKTYGDPAVVLDRNTGNLIAVFSGDTGFFVSTPSSPAGIYVSKSTDNGITWSEPRAITSQLYKSNWYGAFCASGSMLQTADGRIMFVANTRTSSAQYVKDVYEFVCCSEDGGDTWTVLNPDARIPAAGNGNESKLVETSDGTLIMSIRSSGSRRFSRSTDGGVTWSAAENVTDLIEPDCNGDIITYPSADGQPRMLHSLPANASTRRDVAVYMSYDEGLTWPVKRQLLDTYSAYSSLTVLPDGSIGCLVEEGKWDSSISGDDGFRLYFMKFTLDWLTQGADTGDGGNSDIFDGTLNLDGTRYMIIPNSDEFNIPAGGSMTVSLKAKITAQNTQTYISNRVRNYADSNNNDVSGWAMRNVNAITTTSFNYPGSSWVARHHDVNPGISTGEWHHLCWVYSGTASTFYIDGVQSATAAVVSTSAIPSYCDILVGAGYVMQDNVKFSIDNLNDFVTGNIDDVRIYGSALSSAEVTQDMSATAPLDGKDIIAAYDFAEISGTSVTDISGGGHTATLVGFPDNSPGVTVTITAPDPAKGTLEVFNGDTKVLTGRKVDAGTTLTIVPTPAEGYLVGTVTANGIEIIPAAGSYTCIPEADVTFAAEFIRDPDAPLAYCVPSYTYSSTHRNMARFTLSDDQGNSVEIDGVTPVSGESVFRDNTATRFTTVQGATVTFSPVTASGEWMHSYIYIDFGTDGDFDVDPTLTAANADLVAFDRYTGSGSTFYGSNGTSYSDGHTYLTQTSLSFTIPDGIPDGVYRARYKLDWNSVDPCGDSTIGSNAGAIVDFMIRIGTDAAIGSVITGPDANVPEEYFNIQGIKVDAANLAPGIYVMRRGSKTVKILVR